MTPVLSPTYWQIGIGARTVFLASTERFTKDQAIAELRFWRTRLGPEVCLEVVDVSEDETVIGMALAIAGISKDGTGVRPQHLVDLGFAAPLVEKYFGEAMCAVATLAARDRSAPSNVVAFDPKRRAR